MLTGLMWLALPAVAATPLEEARQLVTEGEVAKARHILEAEAKNNPKNASTPLFNYLLGVCEFEEGDYVEARKLLEAAKGKGYGAANLYLGRLAYLDYNFEQAMELYGEFRRHREKSNLVPGETVEELEAQLHSAENALERVERITVIDSIAVPVEDFFRTYKLPHSSGRLLTPDEMPLEDHRAGAVMAFMNEGQDFMIWGEPDSVGNVRLVESIRLTDGKWQEPAATPDFLSKNGYADYPFMMPDGVTLYYASDGNDSMGGYDIFIVTRDPQTGEYRQPQNLGMPFNSPHDDYMLAIDEENGVGWWATDRNLLGDKLTIYVFKVNEMRRNYDPDEEGILDLARLRNYRATWRDEDKEEIEGLLRTVASIDPDKVKESAEFYLPKGNGEYYTSMNQLGSASAKGAMKRYLMGEAALSKSEDHLDSLRRRFARTHADNVARQIEQAEKEIEKERKEVEKLRSDLYRELKKD